jgi:radical SAM protein with 4Fe4S-binding SPASM domain
MKDYTFRLGNVHRDSFEAIYQSESFANLMAASCNESLPGCSQCAFQTYCGAEPVYHHATQGDLYGHRPTSGFCYKNMEIFKHLFGLIAGGDREVLRIFFAWIRDLDIKDFQTQAPLCG